MISQMSVREYRVACAACATEFDAMTAEWCDCSSGVRTLTCSACTACFCRASADYKRRFWIAAPSELRENPARFSASHAAAAFPSAQLRTPQPGAPLVLIVDDEEAIRSLVASFVSRLGYPVVTSDDPHKAFFSAQQNGVKLVITDALMPRMDGRELCRRLKETEVGAALKVIVMTSLYTARRYRSEAMNAFRVDEYLSKPVDFDTLARALDRLAPIAKDVRNLDA